MFPSAAQVGAQSPQPLARRMMVEAGLQVISLAAQAGAAALTITSSPAAASAARPGPWVWMVSVIVTPFPVPRPVTGLVGLGWREDAVSDARRRDRVGL